MEELLYTNNLENLSLLGVESFFSKIREIGKINDKIYIGLSGGSSLDNFYENVLELSNSLEINYWEKVVFFFVDERVVSLSDLDSNYFQLSSKFLDKLIENKSILKNQVLTINLDSKNVAIDYSNRIFRIDILLLGVGPDGHIASLFPKHNLLENESNCFLEIINSPKLPKKRITISKNMIKNCIYSFIFFIGETKLEAYNNFNDEQLSITDCPAKLALTSKNIFILTNLKKEEN